MKAAKSLAIANVVPSLQILVIPMMEVIRSSETSVLTRSTLRHITECGIHLGHRRENLTSYTDIKMLSF
jgi:hypothetical protein